MAESYTYWVTFAELEKNGVAADRAMLAVPFLRGGRVDWPARRVYLRDQRAVLEAVAFLSARGITSLHLYGVPVGSEPTIEANLAMLAADYPVWLAAMGP